MACSRGSTTFLTRVVFGSASPVTIRSGSVGVVSIAGQSYQAAARGASVTLWK